MTTAGFDADRATAFSGRMVEVLNAGSLSLMVSIGHQTRLFDSMAALPASTPEAIAKAAGLQERYVREWLGAMVTGRIVEHDAEAGTYRLPPEHAQSLTRTAGPGNLANIVQFVPLLASVEEGILECFRQGGGLPYTAYARFHEAMAEVSGMVHDASLVEGVLPMAAGIPERLEAGIDVADIGCGSGHAVNLMAKAYPKSRFVGFDFSEEGVGRARSEAERLGLDNARFELRDVTRLADAGAFDLITAFDAIHDQAQPAAVLEGIRALLRPEGTFLMVDIAGHSEHAGNMDHPLAPYLYTVSTMHCMTVSLAQDGEGLGTMWGEQRALQMLREAGFGEVAVHHNDADVINVYYVARP